MSDSNPNPNPDPDKSIFYDLDDFKISRAYDGKARVFYAKLCPCGNKFYAIKHKYEQTKYCSRKCTMRYQSNQVTLTCATCNKTFQRRESRLKNSRRGIYFCCMACKRKAQTVDGLIEVLPDHYKDGAGQYRARAFRHYGAKCSVCGYDEYEQMLDVDHIDSNRKNNKLENLQVLCVWCHCLKTRGVPYHAWQPKQHIEHD